MKQKGLPLQGAHMGKFEEYGQKWPNSMTPKNADNVMHPAWQEQINQMNKLQQKIPWNVIAYQVNDLEQYTKEINLTNEEIQRLSLKEKLQLKSKTGAIVYDGIIQSAENGSLRLKSDYVNKYQNPLQTYEFLQKLGSSRTNQKNSLKTGRQILSNEKNNKNQLKNYDIEFKVIGQKPCLNFDNYEQFQIVNSQKVHSDQLKKQQEENNKNMNEDI